MPSVRIDRTPAGRRLLHSVAAAALLAASAMLATALPAGVAAADEAAGDTVVGRLVQAWPEPGPHHAEGEDAHEPVSWVEPAQGPAVPVVTGDVEDLPAGSTVSVTVGDPVDGDHAAGADARQVLDAELLAAPETPRAPAGPVTNQVTVVMVAPSGTPAGARAGLAEIVDLVNGPVASFWAGETDGAVSVGVLAAHDWITTTAGCTTPAALWDEAAAAVGFVRGPGRHLMLYIPPAAPRCSYALAEVGASVGSGGRMYVRDTSASVIAHELGHNFGLAHSSGSQCDGAVDTGACRTVGYRDYYDVMGVSWSQTGSLNVLQADRLGVLPAGAVTHVPVTAAATTVTLRPVSGRSGLRALRLTDGAGVEYWLEFRPAAGRDAWLGGDANRFALDTGVLLRRAGAFPDTSLLLDGSPTGRAGWDADLQAALTAGSPVVVSGGQFTIVVQEVTADGAVVAVVPSPPAVAGTPAPAPAGTGVGEVLPADGAARAGTVAAPEGDGAAAATPDTIAAPDLAPPAGQRPAAAPSLAAAADGSDGDGGSGGLLLAGAATALAGATTLVVRKLRRPVRR